MTAHKNLFAYKPFILLLILFVILTAWRIVLIYLPSEDTTQIQIWAATYQLLAWFGAVFGLIFSRSWGGYKSVLGRSTLAFSLGLLAQSFGQSVFSYYFYTGVETPYPSLADVGFFGSIPFYIYGVILLGQAAGARVSLKSYTRQALALLLPLLMLGFSYYLFLRSYEFDWSQPLTIFLDFGYPLGQALYVSIAILVFILSRRVLGGIMRIPTLLFLMALIAQYLSDFTFLYQVIHETFEGGGIVDYMYLVAYFLMALSLVVLGYSYKKMSSTES